MPDEIDNRCTTHHDACECRQAVYDEVAEALRDMVTYIRTREIEDAAMDALAKYDVMKG